MTRQRGSSDCPQCIVSRSLFVVLSSKAALFLVTLNRYLGHVQHLCGRAIEDRVTVSSEWHWRGC